MSEESWHDEAILIADLVALNRQISAYALRALDADAGRKEPTAPADEHALGTRLVSLGTALQTRATCRSAYVRSVMPAEHATRDTETRNGPEGTCTTSINQPTAIYIP